MSEDLLKALSDEWNPQRWYRTAEIASKLGMTKVAILGWHNPGLRIRGKLISLKMVYRGCGYEALGSWIIEFQCLKASLKDPAA